MTDNLPKSQSDQSWWKETFIYQIYPRSFKDSNGDGIGDLNGITQSLDYLQELGVETIWLSPIYKSPNDDNGYDVADYCAIMEEFGTMEDFDRLLAEMKKRNMKMVLDLVFNHSSDDHQWFQEARKSKDNPYRDYYIFKEGKDGNPPNNWLSFFEGSAWEYNEATDDYYLHYFTRRQPDLNWENPKVREGLYEAMRFWLDKGVNGFRFDVIPLISKDLSYPDIPADENGRLDFVRHYANGPRVHEFLQEMYEKVLKHYDCYTVGEGIGISTREAADYVAPERKELDSIYHFDHMVLDRDWETGKATPLPLVQFKAVIREWDEALINKGWNTFYLGNHDQPRAVSRFGNDSPAYRALSAKMLMTMLFTQKAIPYLYQGDELGMTNTHFESVEEFDDVHVHNMYKDLKAQGGSEQAFLERMNTNSRDHARTPFLWNAEKQAGFTEGERPWIKINPNHKEINAESCQKNQNSVWHFTKEMIKVRKENPGLIYGDYEDLAPEHPSLFLYKRAHGKETYLVLLNFSDQEQPTRINASSDMQVIIANYEDHTPKDGETILRPYESVIYKF